jgi:hypothetical protein
MEMELAEGGWRSKANANALIHYHVCALLERE